MRHSSTRVACLEPDERDHRRPVSCLYVHRGSVETYSADDFNLKKARSEDQPRGSSAKRSRLQYRRNARRSVRGRISGCRATQPLEICAVRQLRDMAWRISFFRRPIEGLTDFRSA